MLSRRNQTPPHATPSAPRGLWATVHAAAARPAEAKGLYAALTNQANRKRREPDGTGIWAGLTLRSDPARYRPKRAEGIVEETITDGTEDLLVLRSPLGRYARLTPVEAALWRAMDGERTATELATIAFLQHRQLVLVPKLAQGLRRDGFLADPHVGLYQGLINRQRDHGLAGWGRRLTRVLRSHAFALPGVDRLAGGFYRGGGWLLFTWPVLALLGLLSLVGAVAFVNIGQGAQPYNLVDAEQLGPSLLALWVALLVSFVLHELAHALAVKHFGRTVLRGGVMIYFGMPAAFVDTSDIWLAGRRPQILVSLAGPLCDLTVASVAAIAAALLPTGMVGEAAYRLAAASYLAALFNLNPLLELDGYYMLSDWLRLPNLRRRALQFIGGPLWQKLQTGARLNRDEWIFTLYGLFAAAYTVLAVGLALVFWQGQLIELITALWARGDLAGILAALVIVLAVVLPIGLGLVVAAWGLVAAGAAWVGRRGYGRSPFVVSLALAGLALALALLPLRYGVTVETKLIGPLLWLVALAAQMTLRADYRGAAIARALNAFLVISVLEVVAQLGIVLLPNQLLIWTIVQNLGYTLVLFAGFVALLDIDLRQARPAELLSTALLMAVAFLVGAGAIALISAARPELGFVALVLLATPVYASMVALALLLPLVGSLSDSRLLWSWLLLWVGIAVQTWAYLLELRAGTGLTPQALAALVLAAGLWAASWCAHGVALRQVAPESLRWPLEPASGERERLWRAFRHTYAGLYLTLRSYGGSRRARALDDRMDVIAATANWAITLDREEARIGVEIETLSLDAQGARFAEVLRYTVSEIERLTGATFARHAIRAAYDALPWPEREAADRRCFPNTPWARELSQAFGDARTARLRLLRQVERFAACDDSELAALAAAFEPRRVTAGTLLAGPNHPANGIWVIEAGEIALKEGPSVRAELHRGSAFGDELAEGQSFRASVDSDLLFLSGSELQRLLRHEAPRAADGPSVVAAARAFERAPFFHDLPRETLRELARQATLMQVPARTALIRQGRPGGRLFIIISGEAAVLRSDPVADEASTTRLRIVARLGPDELFGEIELLRQTPPMASVVTVRESELVALPHQAVAGLLTNSSSVARGLEQIGTGRLRDLTVQPTS
ncbi:MAG: cyclic nucleotide-binding domain-containing protein [Oscillochloridaceae bacterium umkhey_bin13]